MPVPGTFNVLTGETSQSLTATAQDVPVLGDGATDGRLFSLYMFVPQPAEGETEPATLGDVDITFSQTDGTEKTVTIPEGSIPVRQDYQSNVSGGLVEPIEDNFGLTVDFDGDWSDQDAPVTPGEPVVEPRVGDFYYSDGTWSSKLDAGKTCIGIVFCTDASRFADTPANYGDRLTAIRGYVLALENVRSGKGVLFPTDADVSTLTFDNILFHASRHLPTCVSRFQLSICFILTAAFPTPRKDIPTLTFTVRFLRVSNVKYNPVLSPESYCSLTPGSTV